MKLNEVELGSIVKVIDIEVDGDLRRRFFDMGIVEGTLIEVLYESPFKDPRAYLIRGTVIAIREEDSEKLSVVNQF